MIKLILDVIGLANFCKDNTFKQIDDFDTLAMYLTVLIGVIQIVINISQMYKDLISVEAQEQFLKDVLCKDKDLVLTNRKYFFLITSFYCYSSQYFIDYYSVVFGAPEKLYYVNVEKGIMWKMYRF